MGNEMPPAGQIHRSSEWTCAANWTIAHGSIDDAVTFESSEFPVDSDVVVSTRNLPLVLRPPSPDSGACEIKLCFMQKHEIQQVYVRSTARVYEIYYAASHQSSNEYLCTVRCNIAAMDGLLHATDNAEAVCTPLRGSTIELNEEKSSAESNIATNEDDWVEVKVPGPSPLVSRTDNLSETTDTITGRGIQDFYEATAEISDADPCLSLTIRLLSLQNKERICIDELYVFGDPVEPADSENQAAQAGSLAGNSLMAMLVPTLLQLSRSGTSRMQDDHASDTNGKYRALETGSIASHSADIADTNGKHDYLETGSIPCHSADKSNEISQEKKINIAEKQDLKLKNLTGSIASHSADDVSETPQEEKVNIAEKQDPKLKDSRGTTAEPPQFQAPAEVLYGEVTQNVMPYGQIERLLEQLVSRVSRVEDHFLRFEENMLKPINSMETRLRQVEEQLEVLAKNSQCSGLPHCTKICAASFSCSVSNSSSLYNDGRDCPPFEEPDVGRKDFSSDKLLNPVDIVSTLASAPQLLPGLVITAPEFPCTDGEEEDDAFEPYKDSPRREPKQALSIDDALAAALAGFLSTTTVNTSEDVQTFTVRAPDITGEEDENNDPSEYTRTLTNGSPNFPNMEYGLDEPTAYAQTLPAPELTGEACEGNGSAAISKYSEILTVRTAEFMVEENGIDSKAASPSAQKAVCEEKEARNFNTAKGDDGGHVNYGEETDCISVSNITDHTPAQYAVETNDFHTTEKAGRREDGGGASNLLISEQNDVHILGVHTEESSYTNQEVVGSSCAVAGGDSKDILQIVSNSSSSFVDLEIPILDVKFASSENSNGYVPLEVLLTDVVEFKTEQLPVQETDDNCISEVEISMGSQTNNQDLLVDLDCYDITFTSSNEETERWDAQACSSKEMIASLI